MDPVITVLMGIGLSAACGFRIFVPLLAASIAARSGHVTLSSQFQWLGSDAALIAFGAATLIEIGAYYIPWVDNLLDTVASPMAVAAGTILTASFALDLDPFLRWTLAIIAGGGTAGLVQSLTVSTRALSSAGSLGLANPLVATAELGGSILTSVLALVLPVLTIVAIVVVATLLAKRLSRVKKVPPANP